MKSGWVRFILIIAVFTSVRTVRAQEPPGARFQPPPPPSFTNDLEDDEIEELEGDMPGRPMLPDLGMPGQPIPNGPESVDIPPPPPPMYRGAPTSYTKIGSNNNAIRFQIVDGEFYQKGKRRGRATDLRTTKPSPSNSGPPLF